MSEGERFVEKCLQTEVQLQPWPYQVIDNTLSKNAFTKLQEGCDKNLKFVTTELHHIFPDQYKDWDIDFYDETVYDRSLCRCSALLVRLSSYQTLLGSNSIPF